MRRGRREVRSAIAAQRGFVATEGAGRVSELTLKHVAARRADSEARYGLHPINDSGFPKTAIAAAGRAVEAPS